MAEEGYVFMEKGIFLYNLLFGLSYPPIWCCFWQQGDRRNAWSAYMQVDISDYVEEFQGAIKLWICNHGQGCGAFRA